MMPKMAASPRVSVYKKQKLKIASELHCGGNYFNCDWQGRRYTADWHLIKTGGNTLDSTLLP
jgi:hypothetical protein